ncbi:MAG: hypothetical protein ACKVQS_11715 [Fimbriimonadaceae bacterium]
MIGLIVFLQVTPKMTTIHLEGWRLRVEESLAGDADWKSAKSELTRQLQQINRVVGDEPLAKLKRVTIWVHRKSPETTCMAYHPGAVWLKDHNMNPDMAKGVEVGNVKNFVSWTYEQPWMVMHELAHAYHDQFLSDGFENKVVKGAFASAMASKKYDKILHWNGSETKHYATSNQMEYFAETTESYFGTNDFYPFVRAELMSYDRASFSLMETVWGKPVKRQ